jgi:hypothetical protein
MIAVLLPFVGLLTAATLLPLQRGTGRRWSVHVLAIGTALLIIPLARAASSCSANQCALELVLSPAAAIAEVHR